MTDPILDPESRYLRQGALSGADRVRRGLLRWHGTLAGRIAIGPALVIGRCWSLEARRLASGHGRLRLWLSHGVTLAPLLFWIVGVCRIPLAEYGALVVYPSIALGLVRSFAGHRAAPDPLDRTAVVEAGPFWSLLFLNNNLHIVHHRQPALPWYRIPAAWRAPARPDRSRLRPAVPGRLCGDLRALSPQIGRTGRASGIRGAAMTRVAGLPMYDFGRLAAANDALWHAIAAKLAAAGLRDVPATLDRSLPIGQLWQDPRLLLAQTCGYPLMTSLAGQVRLVATPRYRAAGCNGSAHGSALIVPAEDYTSDLAGLRGRRCAANERHSNTGMNLLRATIADFADGTPFFQSVTWTGSHRASLAMVAAGQADLAAIDAVTLAQLGRIEPELAGQVRILAWTESTPGLPLITAARTDDGTITLLRAALAEIETAPDHAALRDELLLDGFDLVPETAYRSILLLERRAIDLGYPHLC